MNNNFFDSFPYLQQMGDQFQKMFGEDFVRNMMSQMQVPSWGQPQNNGGAQSGDRFWSGGSGGSDTNGSQGPSTSADGQPLWNPFGGMGGQPPKQRVYPPVDVYETRHEVVLTLEIPGMERASDIHVAVFPDHVVVKGSIERNYQSASSSPLATAERYVGPFERRISLPVRVRKQHAKAVYRSGLLELRLLKEGKSTESEGNTIDVDFV